jgi:hypothetical protein
VEGRLLTRENAEQLHQCRTQSRESGTNGLERVREADTRTPVSVFAAKIRGRNRVR